MEKSHSFACKQAKLNVSKIHSMFTSKIVFLEEILTKVLVNFLELKTQLF